MTKEKTFKLVATAASGLEALVGKELRDLGIPCEVENGRAVFEGTVETIATANLWLRTADRIKIVVGEFNAYSFDELFEKRDLVASKLKDCIRDKGYTKVSFAAKADISRPTLDKLLNGNIDNKCTFDRHLQKILKMLNMSVEELMFYHSTSAKNINTAVFSQNTPENHKMSDLAKKQYDLLLDVIDLCAIYY